MIIIVEGFIWLHAWMLKVKGIHTRSPNTSMKPSLSAIMSHLQKVSHEMMDQIIKQNNISILLELVIKTTM